MTFPLTRKELKVGLVLHLDPIVFALVASSIPEKASDRPTTPHFFLCIAVNGKTSTWVNLTSSHRFGRVPLPTVGRIGSQWWTSHVSVKTFLVPSSLWVADLDAINAAMRAGGDNSYPSNRNMLHPAYIPDLDYTVYA